LLEISRLHQEERFQMSQVRFKTTYEGKNVEVMAGWDNPLQYYHLTIFNLDDPDEEVIFSGMDHWGFSTKSPDRLHEQLQMMGIESPVGFAERVQKKLGNVFMTWDGENWIDSKG